MALKWIDGAETWGAASYNGRAYQAGSMSTATPGRVSPGTRHLTSNASDSLTTPSLGVDNTWIIGFGLRQDFAGSSFQWRILNAGGEQLRIETFANGANFGIRIKRGATTIVTADEVFAPGVWHYFELKAVIRTGVNGSYELRHNEVTIESGSGLDLADLGSDGADGHAFGFHTQGIDLDDIYIADGTGTVSNDFLGDSVAVGILPDGDGAQTDWTPSTGMTHFDLVDDPVTAPNDADFVSSDTNGQIDLYTFADLPATGLGTIHGIQINVAASMETVGSRTLRPKFRNAGGTLGDGDDFVVDGTTVLEHPIVMDQNPISAAAWTKSDIDGGQFGVEVVS